MTSSRRRRAHLDSTGEGAWGHVLNDAWREHLDEVDVALSKLGDPLRDPLKTVTGPEFVNALWQIPQHKRSRFLADLKVPAARRPSASIEDDVGTAALARMSRWKDDRLNHAVAFMMSDALKGPVADFAHADADASTVLVLAEECLDELLNTPMPHGLLVAGLVAALRDIAPGATLAAWLRRHPLPGAPDTGEHIAVAAAIGSILTDLPWEAVPRADEFSEAIDTSHAHPPAFEAVVDDARHAFASAADLTSVALEQLQQLRLPDLNGLRHSLDHVEQAYHAVATAAIEASRSARHDVPAHDADLTTLEAALTAAAHAIDPARQATRRLRAMELPTELGSCACALQERCRAADDGDPAAVELVHGLVRLADAKTAGATVTELTALDAQLRPLVPSELTPLLLGIMLGQAQLSAAAETTTREPVARPQGQPADETAAQDTTGPDAPEGATGNVGDELKQPLAAPGPEPLAHRQLGEGEATEPVTDASVATQTNATLHEADNSTKPSAAAPAAPAGRDSLHNTDGKPGVASKVDAPIREADGLRGHVRAALLAHDTGLAYWLARAGDDVPLADALKVATLAETLGEDVDSVADATVSALEMLDPNALGRDRLAALTALAAALRTTIVTGRPDAGAVLELLSVHVADHLGLSTVMQAVATAAQRGALAGGQLRGLSDRGVVDELAAVQRAAAAEMHRSRKVLLRRATTLAEQLFAPQGAIGSLLTAVIADDRRALDRIQDKSAELGDPAKRKRLLDDLDRMLRSDGSSARPLQGKARQKLNDWIDTALERVHAWIRIARAQQRANEDRHLPGDLVALKGTVVSAMSAARADLSEVNGSADARGGTVLLRVALDTAEQLVAGQPPISCCDGSSVDQIVGRALLRAPQITLDDQLRPRRPEDLTVDALTEALDQSWMDVITARAGAGDFATARQAVAVAAIGDPSIRQQYTVELDSRLAAHRARSKEQREKLDVAIRRATRFGQLDDDEQLRLSTVLEIADPSEREDLNVVDAELTAISDELPALAAEAEAKTVEHLQRLVADQKASVEQEDRVRRQIEAQDLASADEILAAIEAGQDLPDPVTLDALEAFFPGVPEALKSSGLTPEAISAIRAGVDTAGLSFQGMPEQTRTANAAALEAWRVAATATERNLPLAALTAPLRLAGIEARNTTQLPAAIRDARSPDRRFMELTGVRVVGNAIVPAFGSLLDGKLRLLLVWGPQTPRSIVNWIGQDTSDKPVLVCLFGVMDPDDRRQLAVATAARPGKPVAVLDTAALTFLAGQPEPSITTTLRILLPFATTNPYVPQAEGNVPTEMFYGRNHELVRITGPTDCLVYGGRQLGKSALLRAAERRHIETGEGIAVYVSTQRPHTLWDALRSALEKNGVSEPGRRARRDAYIGVIAAVTAWLDANPGMRILALIDECDDFFDVDAKDGFTQTTRLRDLRNQTGQGFKPVFAGLHEVARFASLPNQPFAHLGKPLPVGPLPPAEAFRLVTQPLATLGIRFDHDAAWRMLAYCNNQPILLQLACQYLVNHVYSNRDEFTPIPYVIGDDELEQVWGSPTLVAEVSGKLRLTLDLDPRYGVVARVLGQAAHEDNLLAMKTVTLREECETWWPKGFDGITDDEFRALLTEMVTLGVLVKEGTSWALRSPNVRRTLGTSDDIAEWLLRADQATVPGPHLAGDTRQQLAGARVAPLTEVQLADVIGRRNQFRIVLGSRATGADLVGDLLEHSKLNLGNFELITPGGKGSFLDELAGGRRGGKHRVVYSDVTSVNSESVRAEIDEAPHRLPGDGVTRSAVLHLGIEQAEVWLELLDPGQGGRAADTVVACRRLNPVGLERWSHQQHGQFSDPAERDRLLEMTGGWPLLIDSVASACANGTSAAQALRDLRTDLDGALGEDLLDATGLPGSVLEPSYAALTAIGAELLTDEEDSTFEQVLLDAERPAATLAALIAAGAVTRNNDGALSLEPVAAELWQRYHRH